MTSLELVPELHQALLSSSELRLAVVDYEKEQIVHLFAPGVSQAGEDREEFSARLSADFWDALRQQSRGNGASTVFIHSDLEELFRSPYTLVFPVRGMSLLVLVSLPSKLVELGMVSVPTQELASFARGIAHEFNNILAALKSLFELISEDRRIAHEVGDLLEGAREQLDRAQTLVEGIRLHSELLSETREPVAVDIAQEVKSVVEPARSTWLKFAQVEVRLSEKLPRLVIDPRYLPRILLILLSNAADAVEKVSNPKVEVEVGTQTLDEKQATLLRVRPGAYLTIKVRDNGSGISKEDLPHIFEPFFSTKESASRLGLGLASLKGMLANAGGTVTVTSKEGEMTEFCCYLPLQGPELAN